jgi:hypothetical protein
VVSLIYSTEIRSDSCVLIWGRSPFSFRHVVACDASNPPTRKTVKRRADLDRVWRHVGYCLTEQLMCELTTTLQPAIAPFGPGLPWRAAVAKPCW